MEVRPTLRAVVGPNGRISELWTGHTLSKGDLRSVDIPVCGFPELSSSGFHELARNWELGTGKSPEPADRNVYATSDNSEMHPVRTRASRSCELGRSQQATSASPGGRGPGGKGARTSVWPPFTSNLSPNLGFVAKSLWDSPTPDLKRLRPVRLRRRPQAVPAPGARRRGACRTRTACSEMPSPCCQAARSFCRSASSHSCK